MGLILGVAWNVVFWLEREAFIRYLPRTVEEAFRPTHKTLQHQYFYQVRRAVIGNSQLQKVRLTQ